MMDKERKAAARATAMKLRDGAAIALPQAGLALASMKFPLQPRPGANILSGFHPYQSEIDILPLFGKLAGEGWTTALPVIVAPRRHLDFRRWLPGEPLIPGRWDIPRPLDEAPQLDPDVLLVPLLAFDRSGGRLGYGGGFYDRTLERLRSMKLVVAIGVAFACQEVPQVDVEIHDQKLDFVMTEKEVIRCG